MIHKISLNFISDTIENDYRIQQQVYIKKEFTLFTIQTLFFFIAYILYYFQEYTFNAIIIANILGFLLIIIISRYVIQSYPKWNEYILPFLQAYIAYIWNLDNFFPTDIYDPNYDYDASYEYNWYYGFQAFYFHFAIMQLGYQVWPQTVILFGIYIQYITYYPTPTLEYSAMCLTLLLVFIGLTAMKYTNEKMKRQQFIDNREKNIWLKSIDKIMEELIIVVRFDHRQDQIILQQINDLAIKRLGVASSKELREFCRDLQVKKGRKIQSCKSKNLEDIIRYFLLCEQYQSITQKFEVNSKQLNKSFQVKLIQQVLQEQQCIILIFTDDITQETKKIKQIARSKDNFIIYQLKTFLREIKFETSKLKLIQSLLHLSSTRFLLSNELDIKKKWITISYIRSQLLGIFGNKTTFINKQSISGININFIVVLHILVQISSLFSQIKEIKLKKKVLLNIERLKITMIGQMPEIYYNLKFFFSNMNFTENFEFNQTILLNCLDEYQQSGNNNKSLQQHVFTIYMCKFLLWNCFKEKNFRLRLKDLDTHLSFELNI